MIGAPNYRSEGEKKSMDHWGWALVQDVLAVLLLSVLAEGAARVASVLTK